MVFDLVAGAKQRFAVPGGSRPARVVVFDSGLGGLTVFPAVRAVASGASLFYAADDAVFPYGGLSEPVVRERVEAVVGALVAAYAPDVIAIACHTISTVVLPHLRARWPEVAFVGTVPAIKPAVAASTSRMISVLATPGTVARDYTQDLVSAYAQDCAVTLVGARRLASIAEEVMRGEPVADDGISNEIAPAFVADGARRTDTVVLACTHYPLILPRLQALAHWPVTWIDPAPAIARQVARLLGTPADSEAAPAVPAPALFTRNREPEPALATFLAASGLQWRPSPAFAALDQHLAA